MDKNQLNYVQYHELKYRTKNKNQKLYRKLFLDSDKTKNWEQLFSFHKTLSHRKFLEYRKYLQKEVIQLSTVLQSPKYTGNVFAETWVYLNIAIGFLESCINNIEQKYKSSMYLVQVSSYEKIYLDNIQGYGYLFINLISETTLNVKVHLPKLTKITIKLDNTPELNYFYLDNSNDSRHAIEIDGSIAVYRYKI